MPLLKNPRHERFCQLVVGGIAATHAYREVAGARAGKPENDDVHSHEWSRRADVRARIQELMAENAQRAQMTREELLSFYTQVIRTPADQVPAGSPVIQSYEKTEHGHKIRIADKIAAGSQMAKMTGWNQPEQIQIAAADSLTKYLAQLRAQPFWSGGTFMAAAVRATRVIELENGANGEESRCQGADGVK
jgi:phage terminase small subunit